MPDLRHACAGLHLMEQIVFREDFGNEAHGPHLNEYRFDRGVASISKCYIYQTLKFEDDVDEMK
ncbi:hypothetical protein Scep_017804 [Stephania cephalantha]|uniref:Uncharacterized protein n=1 Tax=Stephania cephalantha TaxID=152367 RepID=A0AAP0NXA0_9MAGN